MFAKICIQEVASGPIYVPCSIQGMRDLLNDDINLPPLQDFLMRAEEDWLHNFPPAQTEENGVIWNKITNILGANLHYQEDQQQLNDDDEVDDPTSIHTPAPYLTQTALGKEDVDYFDNDPAEEHDQFSTISTNESRRTISASGNYSSSNTTHYYNIAYSLTSLLLLGSGSSKRKNTVTNILSAASKQRT